MSGAEKKSALDQQRSAWRDLSEDALLDVQFDVAEPEELAGLSEIPPQPGETPIIEFAYDVQARGRKARCVYCKWENHYVGIVVKYPTGRRNLVGRDCAVTHHGADFGVLIRDFDAARDRQDYLRRRSAVLACQAVTIDELQQLRRHPAVATFSEIRREWRNLLGSMWPSLAEVAHRDGILRVERRIQDHAAEQRRLERLGPLTKEERRQLKLKGELRPIWLDIVDTVGTLDGAELFRTDESVSRRLDEIDDELRSWLRKLAKEQIKTPELKAALAALGDLRLRVAAEIQRLHALPRAFEATNLERVAAWCQGQAEQTVPRAAPIPHAHYSDRRNEPGRPVGRFGKFGTDGVSFTRSDDQDDWSLALPNGFFAPKGDALPSLAAALTYVPGRR